MTLAVPGLPPLTWTGTAGTASSPDDGSTLVLQADAGTDWSNDALGGAGQHGATALVFAVPEGDFTLSARVRVEGERTTFDAAVLALWGHRDLWAKLCFEQSPQGQPMVVSVVTVGSSDDCNSTLVTDPHVHLRITRVGSAFAFHSSSGGRTWDFVRLFRLGTGDEPLQVGFMAQAPNGESCTAVFDGIRLSDVVPGDLRDGT